MSLDPIKQAWQSSVEIAGSLPLEEVRRGADKFYRVVRWRNRIEYAACVVAVVIFTAYIFFLPHLLQKIGSALVILGTGYAGWQLHCRASAEAPEEAGEMPILAFARGQLVRHRDALRGIFWWYLLPFIPGLLLVMIGSVGARAGETTALVAPSLLEWLLMVVVGALFAGIWWLNQKMARKLQRHIDEIDALMGESA